MPVVPAKWLMNNELQGVLASQFWGQTVESSRSPDGLASTVQFEPPPLTACAPSGLSRSQFLVAVQASGLPVLPALQGTHGGLVLDRVLATLGAHDWWACILGRCKVQRLLQKTGNSSISEAFWDLDNWGLQAVSNANLGRGLSAKVNFQLESSGTTPGQVHDKLPPVSGTAQLRQKISRHEVVVRVGVNEPLVDGTRYSVAPLQACMDVQPCPGVRRNFHYRLGVCQASESHHSIDMNELPTGPSSIGAARSSSGRGKQGMQQPHSSLLQAQGGMSVQGEKYLWRGDGMEASSSDKDSAARDSAAGDAEAQSTGGWWEQGRHMCAITEQRRADVAEGRRWENVITPADIQQSIMMATDACVQLRAETGKALEWVQKGLLREKLANLGSNGQQGPRGPWSLFVEPPHIKVGGLLGCLGNLSHRQSRTSAGTSAPWVASAQGLVCGAVSAQLGSLRSNFLDFSRISARLDVGMVSAPLPPLRSSVGLPAGLVPAPVGPWHALTLSASQQLFGPIRLNLDTRFALDPQVLPTSNGTGTQENVMDKVSRHACSLRPHQLDSVWSLDSVVPGSQGLARVVAWYSPMRNEGMLEVRML